MLKKFWEAMQIEGVLHYGFAFFCVKFSVYSLMLWLPLFLGQTLQKTNSEIASMVTWYEIGTLIGGSALGLLSDLLGGKRPPVAIFAIIVAGTISFYITFNF